MDSNLRNVGVAMGKLAGYAEVAAPDLAGTILSGVGTLYPGLPPVRAGISGQAGAGRVAAGHARDPCHLRRDAVVAAERLGFPVVLKVQSADLPHKTEAGGVRLNLADRDAVTAAYAAMLADVARHRPDAAIDGVLVQRMAPKGQELVIGMVDDATFGPIMMLGFGGTTVELFGDVVHAPAPVDDAEATRMHAVAEILPFADGVPRGAAD